MKYKKAISGWLFYFVILSDSKGSDIKFALRRHGGK